MIDMLKAWWASKLVEWNGGPDGRTIMGNALSGFEKAKAELELAQDMIGDEIFEAEEYMQEEKARFEALIAEIEAENVERTAAAARACRAAEKIGEILGD